MFLFVYVFLLSFLKRFLYVKLFLCLFLSLGEDGINFCRKRKKNKILELFKVF